MFFICLFCKSCKRRMVAEKTAENRKMSRDTFPSPKRSPSASVCFSYDRY